jgi:hypothetical protein
MKIKENTFSTLVLELFFPSITNCRKLKIKNFLNPITKKNAGAEKCCKKYRRSRNRCYLHIAVK